MHVMDSVYLIRNGKKWHKLSVRVMNDQRAKDGWTDSADIVYNVEGRYFVRADDSSVNEEYIDMIIWSHGGLENVPDIPLTYYPGGIGFV